MLMYTPSDVMEVTKDNCLTDRRRSEYHYENKEAEQDNGIICDFGINAG